MLLEVRADQLIPHMNNIVEVIMMLLFGYIEDVEVQFNPWTEFLQAWLAFMWVNCYSNLSLGSQFIKVKSLSSFKQLGVAVLDCFQTPFSYNQNLAQYCWFQKEKWLEQG